MFAKVIKYVMCLTTNHKIAITAADKVKHRILVKWNKPMFLF